ncbi:hypothetical protein T10_883 [Trichinella papuae]|uniref:Uncharacterized protein n=1 Tax=Trichinella papuae TaxID=268474 RepID=A0A0V1MTN3_9BILA|nr:hypothetical protein T10_883 [Trichinella papuae]
MQMTPYKNPWTARGRSKENKRHVRFLVPTDSAFSNYGSPFSTVGTDRGRHEADRGRHEADRGRHEAELWNEDIRYMRFPMGPNSVSLG